MKMSFSMSFSKSNKLVRHYVMFFRLDVAFRTRRDATAQV